MRVTYVTVESGDWAALYIDGKLADGVEQNHSLDVDSAIYAVVKACGGEYEHFEVTDEWSETQGLMPETADEIPAEAKNSY